MIPRSILIESLESIPYLFISLGDGSVISYVIVYNREATVLTERRKVVLGTLPTILKKFRSLKPSASNNIFACSDRPSVISTTNQKLIYSSVNLKQVDYMCQINSKAYPYSLALLSGSVLRIGTIDNIQKLHIRTVPLNETARRIAYQTETQTFGVITFRLDFLTSNGELKPLTPSASTQCANIQQSRTAIASLPQLAAPQLAVNGDSAQPATSSKSVDSAAQQQDTQITYSFLVFNQNTFEVLHSVQFSLTETATSVLSMNFDNDPANNYYVVGTSYVNEDEPEPRFGRIVLFKYTDNKLMEVCEKEVKGAPFCMVNFNGKLLVAVSNTLKLFEFKDNQLNQLASYTDNVFILTIKCKNDFVLIGDLMKSCSLLNYHQETSTFEMVARDFTPIWLNSLEMIDDDNFIMSDSFQNLLTLRKDR